MPRVSAVTPDKFASFGELLKYLRRRAGLTQLDLSIGVGYSDTQISRIEKNQRVPDAATLTARFVPALHLAQEPAWVARLLALAQAARDDPAPTPAPAPATPGPPAAPNNLPEPLTRFIGRDSELEDVQQLLVEQRLVTLTGPGGTGKTRLALHVAGQLTAAYPDGVWLVEIGSLTSGTLVLQAVAATLEIREEQGRPLLATVLGQLRAKSLLLVFDNCEHLVDACAQAAEALLQACPRVRIMATSRERMSIPGEYVYPVPPLSLPPVGDDLALDTLRNCESVRLFVDRAAMAMPNFALTGQNAPAIVQICRHLDGIPLALELAAARVPMLPVGQIAARLDDRFRLLTGGSRTALPRHQTLSALIDWSYNLLSDAERALLRRLAVLRGSWTLEAAEAVANVLNLPFVLDGLTQLVNKSLVIADRNPADEARYRMLETIRQFAWDKLVEAGEAGEARGCHLDYYLSLAEAAEPQLHGHDQMTWLARLEADHDNLRAALEWSLANPASGEQPLRLGTALFWYWYIRSYPSEGRYWLEAALDRVDEPEPSLQRAWGLYAAAGLNYKAGDYWKALTLLQHSIAVFRKAGPDGRHGLGHALIILGELSSYRSDVGPPTPMFQEAEALLRQVNDKWGLALALHWRGVTQGTSHPMAISLQAGDLPIPAETEQALYQESLDHFRELGDRWAQTMPLGGLGHVAFRLGDRAAGRAVFEACLAIQREFRDQMGVAWSLWALGNEALDRDDIEQASALYGESLVLYRTAGHKQGTSSLLGNLAELARREFHLDLAANLHSESLALRREMNNRERIAYTLAGMGRLAWSQGDYAQAGALQVEALAIRRESHVALSLADSVEAFAILAAFQRQPEHAVRLFAAALPFQDALCFSILPIWRAERERGLTAARAQFGEAAFAAAWAEGQAMTLDQAITVVLEAIDAGRGS